jgi:cytochrome c biogenesis protein CcdA
MGLFAEGVESLKLACSLVLLIPAVAIVLLGRRRVWLVPTWIAAVTVIAWLRFIGWWSASPGGLLHVGAGVALAGAVIVAWQKNTATTDVTATVGGALLAGWTWVPCVGRELGGILNDARAQPWVELGPTAQYLLGLFLPLVLIAAAAVAWPKLGTVLDSPRARTAGLGIMFLVAGLVSVTLFDDLAGELARRSRF